MTHLSFKNKKLEESLSPPIYSDNKTISLLPIDNKLLLQNNLPKENRKFSIYRRSYFSRSAFNFNKRKNFDILNNNKFSRDIKSNNPNKHLILSSVSVSKNIFKELDKIEKTLLSKYQHSFGSKKTTDSLEKSSANNNEKYEFKEFSDLIQKSDKNEINGRNMKNNLIKNIEEVYDSIPIRSKSTINFFNKKNKAISKSLFLNGNNYHFSKKSKDIIDKTPVTGFLGRRTINDLPITYPLFFSYNNSFNSMSEKSRVDRIISKLIYLRTHMQKDDLNKYEILKEFLVKNGIKDKKYFKHQSLNNLYHYLFKPFSFPPEYILSDVINEGINYKQGISSNEMDKTEENNILNYSPKKHNLIKSYESKRKTRNTMSKSKTTNKIIIDEKRINRYFNSSNTNIKNKTLPTLIKDLETELRQMKLEKLEKLENYHNSKSNQMEMQHIVDKNKYVPNLCLVSKGFKEKCKENVDKVNKKIIETKSKEEKLKEINKRLYYDNIKGYNLDEFDRNDIQRTLKLTEFVVMERAKKKYLFRSAKNNYTSIIKRINRNKKD